MESLGFILIDVFSINWRLGEITEVSYLRRKSQDVYMLLIIQSEPRSSSVC